ncbi:hypothetical protein MUK42_15181 [Musa troglodytarum]|uniref:Uncharacterized protein n=1 Tax=Musa troglodytarum TaxID=320322 RepID=A0A9E7HYT9_9LILI|nr:hypothetical protein MUK42_15181 [Musa troglodytarum]
MLEQSRWVIADIMLMSIAYQWVEKASFSCLRMAVHEGRFLKGGLDLLSQIKPVDVSCSALLGICQTLEISIGSRMGHAPAALVPCLPAHKKLLMLLLVTVLKQEDHGPPYLVNPQEAKKVCNLGSIAAVNWLPNRSDTLRKERLRQTSKTLLHIRPTKEALPPTVQQLPWCSLCIM